MTSLGRTSWWAGIDEVREERRLGRRPGSRRASSREDAVGAEVGEERELGGAGGGGAAVGEVDDLALVRPSMAACGASTKLVRPWECQW